MYRCKSTLVVVGGRSAVFKLLLTCVHLLNVSSFMRIITAEFM